MADLAEEPTEDLHAKYGWPADFKLPLQIVFDDLPEVPEKKRPKTLKKGHQHCQIGRPGDLLENFLESGVLILDLLVGRGCGFRAGALARHRAPPRDRSP